MRIGLGRISSKIIFNSFQEVYSDSTLGFQGRIL